MTTFPSAPNHVLHPPSSENQPSSSDAKTQLYQHAAPVAHKVVWPRRAPKDNLPLRTQELNSLTFLKSQPTLPVHDVTHVLGHIFYLGFLFWHLWMTHPGGARGYRRRKWIRRYEFKSWTRLIGFHIALIPLGKVWIQFFSPQLWVNSRTDCVLQPWWGY